MTEHPTARSDAAIFESRVEGTAVHGLGGGHVGSIARVAIDKRSGQVTYVAINCGSLLGVGTEYRALPWSALHYNEAANVYEVVTADLEATETHYEDDIQRPVTIAPHF
jgi:hypothetical protein